MNQRFQINSKLSLQLALRIYIAFWWLMICYFGINGLLPHMLTGSPLFDISIDNSFWLFHYSGLAQLMKTNPWLVAIMESIIFICSIFLFIRHSSRLSVLFIGLHILLSLFIQTYSGILTKISVVPVMAFIPFIFKSGNFRWAWSLPRYYLIYLMASAGIFKIINGGLFHTGQMEAILWNQHSDLIFYGSQHVALWLSNSINDLGIGNAPYILITILECSFIGALFTRKFDRIYILLLLLLCAIFYFMMRIHTFEILFLLPALFQISEDNI